MSSPARRAARSSREQEAPAQPPPEVALADPFARRHALEQRLEDGYRRIEEARLNQLDVRAWEDFWIQLLREYERVCDEIGDLAA